MTEEFSHLADSDRIKAENEYMKMKLMLEKGAIFPEMPSNDVTPEMENEFLSYITEFERQFENPTYVKVAERLGHPGQFKPANCLSEEDRDEQWEELDKFMRLHGISLSVCSPNVRPGELYRFALEELFELEIEDVWLPGMMNCFIYDEFHPDVVYDNTRIATEQCVKYILQREPLKWTYEFYDSGLRLNDRHDLKVEEFKTIVNRFKEAYDELEIVSITGDGCTVEGKESCVTGKYVLRAKLGADTVELSNAWKVHFLFDELIGYWFVNGVEIEGISF